MLARMIWFLDVEGNFKRNEVPRVEAQLQGAMFATRNKGHRY